MRKPIIAIDGYSSTGKSSLSKEIAKIIGVPHLDTGALYRGITVFALENFKTENGINFPDLFENLDKINLEFRNFESVPELFLNGKNISQEIRTMEVSENVSDVAKQPEVREFLLEKQREMAGKTGIVADGRDIGTVILPNADYKFFLTADPEVRMQRRLKEMREMGIMTDENSVKNNLLMRDKTDSERESAPLKMAEDAILIDNSTMTKQETLEKILSYIEY